MAHTRRGTRITCHIPVTITSLDAPHWFSERGVAIVVNPHGCAVRFSRSIEVGTVVLLEGLPANAMAAARVVNCASLQEPEAYWLLGLELHKPGNVWGIEIPPTDWLDSKAPSPGSAEPQSEIKISDSKQHN